MPYWLSLCLLGLDVPVEFGVTCYTCAVFVRKKLNKRGVVSVNTPVTF
jgi:hypothetical protein